MTKSEFQRLADGNLNYALIDLASEVKEIVPYERVLEEMQDLIELENWGRLRRMLDVVENEGEAEYWIMTDKTLQPITCYEDVEGFLDEDDDGYLPEADDDYYYKVLKGVR